MKTVEIGQQVVRSKGDYVVGRVGEVVAIDTEKQRAQVQWNGETKTWVSFGSLEPTSIPYEIVKGISKWPQYRKIKGHCCCEGKETGGEIAHTSNCCNVHNVEPMDCCAIPECKKVMYNGQEVEAINFGALLKN